MKWRALVFLSGIMLLVFADPALAKMDLVILPTRQAARLTIYNAADLTLVRDARTLTLKEGINRLQFSWANTLIDPTSLEMIPKDARGDVDILELDFPPRVREAGIWRIRRETGGPLPVEISYLTSGLSWRAFYIGTLATDGTRMDLEGYVRVTNQSGEDYENAEVRLVVGKINLVDRIADLARREYAYGSPVRPPVLLPRPGEPAAPRAMAEAKKAFAQVEEAALARPKEIVKEGLSEYFLYTIEGTETIPNGWSKRLPSLRVQGIPVVNLYRFEEERFGRSVVRFLSFRNDELHRLGKTPIPGGVLKVYRGVDPAGHLSYEGETSFKYIPVGEDVELNLGAVSNVMVEPTLMSFKTDRFLFDQDGNVRGWDEIHEFQLVVKNTRQIPVKVEITRNFQAASWDLDRPPEGVSFEKVDLDTVKFSLGLGSGESRRFSYVLTLHQGDRGE